MTEPQAIYYVVTGASAVRCAPDLLKELGQFNLPIYTIMTESTRNIISPYNLADQEGHTLVDSYFDPVMITERPPGLTLVAPATFNTLNKISQGIADSLAHSLVAEAIGAGWPVIVVPAMNQALANHPQTARSIKTLLEWGAIVLESRLEGEVQMMAPIPEIVEAIKTALSR